MSAARLTPAQASDHLGISVQAVYVLNSRPQNGFPEPERIGRTPTWLSAELDAWRAEHPAKRPRRRPQQRIEATPRRSDTSFHDLAARIAFVTLHRRALLTAEMLRLAEHSLREAARAADAEIEGFAGAPDHIRATVRYPAALAASDLARKLRAASERALRQSGASQVWAPSYFVASTGTDPSGRIDEYVREQEQVINS
ncbi:MULTISPECIES: IS200/IS605 family transposase [unclassified Streptomyces]|uniref:IS200/IS605 family transposase n=1 Tax=unclassified Streptomyces TaxID=2593676 RepID=UPI002E31AA7B|nr:IS200/IS605 family transposase [Streptomyces sp. NBC_01431]